MTENAKKFLAEASKDSALKAELAKALSGRNIDAVAKVAKDHGYDVKAEDFNGLKLEVMSEKDLEAVAGGGIYLTDQESSLLGSHNNRSKGLAAPDDFSSAHNRSKGLL